MSIVGRTEWQKLPVTLGELCINTTLRCGQSFRWQKINHEWWAPDLARSQSEIPTLSGPAHYTGDSFIWNRMLPICTIKSPSQHLNLRRRPQVILKLFYGIISTWIQVLNLCTNNGQLRIPISARELLNSKVFAFSVKMLGKRWYASSAAAITTLQEYHKWLVKHTLEEPRSSLYY